MRPPPRGVGCGGVGCGGAPSAARRRSWRCWVLPTPPPPTATPLARCSWYSRLSRRCRSRRSRRWWRWRPAAAAARRCAVRGSRPPRRARRWWRWAQVRWCCCTDAAATAFHCRHAPWTLLGRPSPRGHRMLGSSRGRRRVGSSPPPAPTSSPSPPPPTPLVPRTRWPHRPSDGAPAVAPVALLERLLPATTVGWWEPETRHPRPPPPPRRRRCCRLRSTR